MTLFIAFFYDTTQPLKMPAIRCPVTNCSFVTDDVEPVLAAALLNLHSSEHSGGSGGRTQGPSARPPPIERPKLSAGCPRADWEVFSAK